MKVTDFDYALPKERIAQHPVEPRDHSRLLVVDKTTGEMEHRHFYNLPEYLKPGDLLVFNDTRVIPARLYGFKDTGAHVEVFLLTRLNNTDWEVLVRPGKKLQVGAHINFSDELSGTIIDHTDFGGRIIRFSAAAPTAGLHFTKELLQKIKDMGCEEVFVTLNVGLGTFRPVTEENIEDHPMHREFYSVTPEAAAAINRAKAEGRRIIAVGTTAVRTLESAGVTGEVKAGGNWTQIYIYPGYQWHIVDALVTNFHLPQSTLLMLVSSLSSREVMLRTYEEAVKLEYRFFSFGDAMFITELDKK